MLIIILWLYLCREVIPQPISVVDMTLKKSDGEELLEMQSTPSLPSLPG